MPYVPCPEGRLQALAMASMHLRAVVGPHELRLLAAPAVNTTFGPKGSTVPARLRPRDEGGRFVRYAWLLDAINFDNGVTDMEFDSEPSVEADAAPAIEVDDLFPYLTDELADELSWADPGNTGADGPRPEGSLGPDRAVRPPAEGSSGEARDRLEG